MFVATVSCQSEVGKRNALAMSLLTISEFTGNRKYVVSNYVEIYFLFNCRFFLSCPNFNADVLLQPSHSDFLPSTPLGCWNITPQVSKLKNDDPNAPVIVDLDAHKANPGKCAAYCFRHVKVGYGALSRGGRCYCIANYTLGGSSFGCNAQCGWSNMFWPGYLCGASTTYTIASVYQDRQGKLT